MDKLKIFWETFLDVVKNHYADFNGRTGRYTWAQFFLVNLVLSLLVGIVASLVHFQMLNSLYSLALLLPGLGIGVRRLHDLGRSGWLMLVALTGIGALVLVVWFFFPGQPQENEYGPVPDDKRPGDDVTIFG